MGFRHPTGLLVDEAKHPPADLDTSGVRGASTLVIFCASVICIATAVVAGLIAIHKPDDIPAFIREALTMPSHAAAVGARTLVTGQPRSEPRTPRAV